MMPKRPSRLLIPLGLALMVAAVLVVQFGGNGPSAKEPGTAAESGTEGPAAAKGPETEEGAPDAKGGESGGEAGPEREQAAEMPYQEGPRIVAVSGHVRDPSGRPLAGVTVAIIRVNPRGFGGRVLSHGLTDENGKYELSVNNEAGLVIDAYDDLHQRLRIKMSKNGGNEHDFELKPVKSP